MRAAANARAKAAARDRPLQPIDSDDSLSASTTGDNIATGSVINLDTSDEDEELVSQNSLRTTEKRRKHHKFEKSKLLKVPTVQDMAKKIRAKYGLSKKIPKSLAKKYNSRSFPLQQQPYNPLSSAPSISNPFVTKEQILYRHIKPAAPENTPVLDDPKSKTGSGIETEFIPYNENVAYEFYDDPNELCDRLRLLIASRAAGNTNHAQEINSLIAELRESGYIK